MCPLRISVFKFFTQRHWLPPVALCFFTEICVSSIPQSKTIHSSPVFSFTSFRSTSFVFGDNSPGADKTIIPSPPLRPFCHLVEKVVWNAQRLTDGRKLFCRHLLLTSYNYTRFLFRPSTFFSNDSLFNFICFQIILNRKRYIHFTHLPSVAFFLTSPA